MPTALRLVNIFANCAAFDERSVTYRIVIVVQCDPSQTPQYTTNTCCRTPVILCHNATYRIDKNLVGYQFSKKICQLRMWFKFLL
jgi:hypothetical protein